MDFQARQELREKVRKIVANELDGLGFELVALELVGGRGSLVLMVFIDRPEGISIQDCAKASRELSLVLDVEDPIPGKYTLEVCSPGIERPVEKAADFARFAGYRAKVRTAPGHGRKRYTGTLQGLDGDTVLLDVDGKGVRIPLSEVERVRLDLTLEEFACIGATSADAASSPELGVPS